MEAVNGRRRINMFSVTQVLRREQINAGYTLEGDGSQYRLKNKAGRIVLTCPDCTTVDQIRRFADYDMETAKAVTFGVTR